MKLTNYLSGITAVFMVAVFLMNWLGIEKFERAAFEMGLIYAVLYVGAAIEERKP
jgi:hypothetical protein